MTSLLLEHEADGPLADLRRIPAASPHGSHPLNIGSLRETRAGSTYPYVGAGVTYYVGQETYAGTVRRVAPDGAAAVRLASAASSADREQALADRDLMGRLRTALTASPTQMRDLLVALRASLADLLTQLIGTAAGTEAGTEGQ